jgi:hypothetical protein
MVGKLPRVSSVFVVVAALTCGCGGKSSTPESATAPSNVPSTIQGSFQLGPLQFAVVSFHVDRAGTLASRVDWGNPNNDIDTAIIRGRCTVDQLIAEAAGCNEAAPSAPPGPRRTDTFSFTLPAGSRSSVLTGPVRVANGVLDVKLDFAGNYIILACVGTSARCQPMGGRPQTRTYSIPGELPAGPIQATVYFNVNFPQPAGDAKGTVTYTYTPQ